MEGEPSQEALGKMLEIGSATYQDHELGKTAPKAETLVRLADLHRVSIDYLLCRTDDPGDALPRGYVAVDEAKRKAILDARSAEKLESIARAEDVSLIHFGFNIPGALRIVDQRKMGGLEQEVFTHIESTCPDARRRLAAARIDELRSKYGAE